jgi:hypothetical protein
MKMKMAGRGMQSAGVGSEIGASVGQWLEDNLLDWLGFADGGELLSTYTTAERKDLIKQAKADLKADIASGDFVVPASARGGAMQSAGVGSDIGNKIETWLTDWWNSLARGGTVAAKKGHSVFK